MIVSENILKYFESIEAGRGPPKPKRKLFLPFQKNLWASIGWGNAPYERVWTVVATCARHKRSVYNFFLDALNATYAGTTYPKLIPTKL